MDQETRPCGIPDEPELGTGEVAACTDPSRERSADHPGVPDSRALRMFDRLSYYGFLALVGVTPLCLTPWTDEPPNDVQWLIIDACAPALALLLVVSRLFLARRFAVRWNAVTLAALALLASQIASAFSATDIWLSIAVISKQVGLFSVFILASNALVDKQDLRRTVGVVAVCGFLVSVYGLAQHFGFDFFPWQQLEEVPTSRGASTLGHPTFAASFLLLSIPLTLLSAALARTWYGRLLAAAAAATMASHFLITGARGAALAACVTMVTVLVVAKLQSRPISAPGETTNPPWRMAWRLALGLIVLVALVAGLMVTTWRVKRSDALALRQGGGAVRLSTFQSAARLWTHHPFTGVGAGNYEIMSPTAWNRQEQERFAEMNRMSYQVHNEYIEALAEQGVIGLGVLLALLYAAMLAAYRISLGAVDRDGRRLGLALLAAVIAAAADALLIFNLQTPGPALYFWMVLGLVVYSGSTLVRDRDQTAPCGARSVGET